jgi:hypothetical protein
MESLVINHLTNQAGKVQLTLNFSAVLLALAVLGCHPICGVIGWGLAIVFIWHGLLPLLG